MLIRRTRRYIIILTRGLGLYKILSEYFRRIIINVAGVLKKILMDRAYIARINEGNFVAVMKNVTDAEAGKTFEQIKRIVEKECNNGKFGVTIEYGIAMRKASNRWIMDIVHEAVNDMRDRKGR